MKFREFVGEKKISVPKIINPIEVDEEYYLGFYISKPSLKRIYDYIKSWFLRYHIQFDSINPYLTLYLLNNLPSNKKEIVNRVMEKKDDVIFSPFEKGSILLVEKNKVEMRLEYNPNEFMDHLHSIFFEFGTDVIKEYCYIKLFEIDRLLDNTFLDEMCYSMPRFPEIKIENVGIRRK